MREGNLHRLILRECGAGDVRLFRNNVGQGLMIRHPSPAKRNEIIARCIELAEAMGGSGYRLAFGLSEGSGDLIGMRRIIITPDMIGRAVAQFASLEVKTGNGRPSDAQLNWAAFVNEFGGIAGVARSVEEARAILGK